MPSVSYDLGYFQAGVRILKDYILSKEIYWPIGAKPPVSEPAYPQMTLGGLMLVQARLDARSLSTKESAEFSRLDQAFDVTRSRWQVAWEAKAGREFHARLVLWRDFLEDYRSDPGNHSDRYSYEVNRRVMLHLLDAEAVEVPSEEIQLLEALDQFLLKRFISGDFIWEADLESGFPQETYWYLYGLPSG